MANIKVTYQSTIRRFSIPSDTTWTGLEAKLRELFVLSPTVPISLSYTDEDGDVITLSTDLELREILSQQQPNGSTSFKFSLNTVASTPTSTSTSNNESWVLEGRQQPKEEREGSVETIQSETSSLREGVSGLQIDQATTLANTAAVVEEVQEMQVEEAVVSQPEPESRPPSYHHITVTNEVDEPTYMSVNSKGKAKETSGETSAAAASVDEQQNESDQNQAPSIELAEQFQALLNQFQDVLAEHPEILETVNDVMDQILRAVPVDIEVWAGWLNSLRSDGQQANEQTADNEQQQGPQQGPQFPFLSPDFWTNIASTAATPWWNNSHYRGGYGPWGRGACPFAAGGRGAYGPAPWNRYGCRRGRGFSGCHGMRAKKFERTREQQQQQQSTVLDEKLRLLHEMGFWEDDAENEELLNRYNGNVDRVIEVLLQRQALKNQQTTSDTTDQQMEDAEEQK